MSEEFITDIIEKSAPVKTEDDMVAELKADTGEPVKAIESAKDDGLNTAAAKAADAAKVVDTAEVKAIASQLGWREDHTGEDAVDASTYILRSKDIQKSMSQHNKDLKGQLSALDGSVEALKHHNEQVYKSELKKLTGEITALKKERRDAIELADVVKVEELDEQIDAIQKDIDAPKPVVAAPKTDNPVYDEWVQDNEWYIEDDAMAQFADNVAEQYIGAPLERVYAIVRQKVQEVFPEKFAAKAAAPAVKLADVKNPVGPKSPVESSSIKGADETFTKADLTSDQIQIMNQFVRGGIMTEEAYIKDIAKMQE